MQNIKELPEIDQHLEMAHQEKTKVKNIQVGRLITPAVALRPAVSQRRRWAVLSVPPLDCVDTGTVSAGGQSWAI